MLGRVSAQTPCMSATGGLRSPRTTAPFWGQRVPWNEVKGEAEAKLQHQFAYWAFPGKGRRPRPKLTRGKVSASENGTPQGLGLSAEVLTHGLFTLALAP